MRRGRLLTSVFPGFLLGMSAMTCFAQGVSKIDAAALNALKEKPVGQATKSFNPEVSRQYGTKGGTKGILVVKRRDGSEQRYRYVELPVLFVKNRDEVYDATSRANVTALADIVREILRDDAEAMFRIEGHASAEGTPERNQELSRLRADKIRRALAGEFGLEPGALIATGYGHEFAQFPNPAVANEAELQQDRRVLVVRVR